MRVVRKIFWPETQSAGGVLVAALLWALLLIGANPAQPALAASAQADDAQHAALVAVGKRIYREAIDSNGVPLKALGPAGVVLEGKDAACVTCHRRSGYGGSEGKYNVRAITGPALFEDQTLVEHAPRIKAQLGTRQRPAYTALTLARALRGGVDSSAKPLESVMPRFPLSDRDVAALAAYLATLSASDSPGVDEEEIHFATVIQPGVSAERRRAMLDIMQAFVKDKTSNTRSNEQRREAGVMRMNRSYRKWVLHVWELSGPSEAWDAQLQNFYRQQAVFALVGGLGNASWQPIHAFAERMEIPSVFAQVDLPEIAAENFYNFYFSRGLTLEAEVLAKFLREQGDAPTSVLQIYRPDEAGLAASAAFTAAIAGNPVVQDLRLEGPADEAFWLGALAGKPGALVLWLGQADLGALPPMASGGLPVYGSYALLGGKVSSSLLGAGSNVRLIYPTDLPPRHDSRLLRTKMWLHAKNIALTDEPTQINTQFAMTLVSDAIGHIMDSFSRDLFVERIEHMVAQTPSPSIYQSVSLGPGQRFAAKGSSVVLLGEQGQLKILSDWIVP
jgi:mono/diheme cytochrome c family protein